MGFLVLMLGVTLNVSANPQDYPQYAQQKVDTDVPIVFVTSEQVKQRLDAGAPQMLVDVRDASSYQKAHLPGAVSIPLSDFPERAVQIPRDIEVVLY
jgi:3-mercaptopyruvate sulfurtransferase SseA